MKMHGKGYSKKSGSYKSKGGKGGLFVEDMFAANEVVVEESAKDPYFKKVAEDFYAFRKNYAIWGDAQRMKSTYLK